jgi:hypothetical protein
VPLNSLAFSSAEEPAAEPLVNAVLNHPDVGLVYKAAAMLCDQQSRKIPSRTSEAAE